MKEQKGIRPEKITQPIQLLAAWLVGLLLTNGTFLAAANGLSGPMWLKSLLVIASVINVPVFLGAIFLLQTRFRPEIQADSYYSQYIATKFGNTPREITPEAIESLREIEKQRYDEMKLMIQNIEQNNFETLRELSSIDEDEKRLESFDRFAQEAVSEVSTKSIENEEDRLFLDKQITLNVNLENIPILASLLKKYKIPVHETFGRGAKKPENFAVAFGDGFTVKEIVTLLNAISEFDNPYVDYAADEVAIGQYEKIALIGAYAVENGIRAQDLKSLIDTNPEISILELYKIIGKR